MSLFLSSLKKKSVNKWRSYMYIACMKLKVDEEKIGSKNNIKAKLCFCIDL